MKKRYFTVVTLCFCGCGQSGIFHVRATNGDSAARLLKENARLDFQSELTVVAVFRGRLTDQHS